MLSTVGRFSFPSDSRVPKVGTRKDTRIVLPLVASHINVDETACIWCCEEHVAEGPLVVEVGGPGHFWAVDSHVLAVNRTWKRTAMQVVNKRLNTRQSSDKTLNCR